MPETPVLCYIKPSFAYFTTQPLALQQGSGWHKTAYEYNAGPPTAPRAGDTWRILRIAYDCARLATPGEQAGMNSPWSVDAINAREVPWLAPWGGRAAPQAIWAGVTLATFLRRVRAAGGIVYLPYRGTPARALVAYGTDPAGALDW